MDDLPFKAGDWVTYGELVIADNDDREIFKAELIKDISCGSGYRIGELDAAHYRKATTEEIIQKIAKLDNLVSELRNSL